MAGAELATRLGVTDRTLRRDVDRLRGLDYPVDATTGTAGGYRLTSGHNLPPLLLDDDEALATAIALATAAVGGAGTEDAALRALTKLQRVLPARLRPQLTALTGTTAAVTPRGAPHVDPGQLGVIAACCRDTEILAFDYHPTRRTFSRRELPAPDAAAFLVRSFARASYRHSARLVVGLSADAVAAIASLGAPIGVEETSDEVGRRVGELAAVLGVIGEAGGTSRDRAPMARRAQDDDVTGSVGEGRVVVVTGANRGLGLEVARQCAARGDSVVLGSRDLAAGRRAAADLGDGVLPVALDVTDPDVLAAAAADVDHAFGRVDVLVNNAAINYDTWQNAVDVDLGVVREALETNVLGAWQTTPSPARSPATCAATACSSTPSAPAGPSPTWAGAVAGPSTRARRASCAPPTCRTAARRAPSPGTGGPCAGECQKSGSTTAPSSVIVKLGLNAISHACPSGSRNTPA